MVRRHDYRHTYVNYLSEHIQFHLVDIGKHKREKTDGSIGYYQPLKSAVYTPFLFRCIGRIQATWPKRVPFYILKQFKDRFDDYPKLTQFDDGKEFYNDGVKTLLEKHGINYFSIRTLIRKRQFWSGSCNSTLQTAMWKYYYNKGTYSALMSWMNW